MRPAWVALVVSLVVGLVIGFVVYRALNRPVPVSASPTTTTTTTTAPPPSTSAPPPTGPLKPLIAGLIDRNAAPTTSYLGVVKAFVVPVYWSDLEPDPDGPLSHPTTPSTRPSPPYGVSMLCIPRLNMAIKLRIYGGITRPRGPSPSAVFPSP